MGSTDLLAVVFLCSVLGDRVRVRGGRGRNAEHRPYGLYLGFPWQRTAGLFSCGRRFVGAMQIMIYVAVRSCCWCSA